MAAKTTRRKVKMERPTFQPDTLDLTMKRRLMLIAGLPAAGKSFSVAALCNDGLEQGFKVLVVDRDRGLSECIEEVCGGVPENLVYKVIREWDDLTGALHYAHEELDDVDWLVNEHVGRIWDFAQETYVNDVYGTTHAERMKHLRAEAEAIIREQELEQKTDAKSKKEAQKIRNKEAGYGGLDGRRDWGTIKAQHNGDVFDKWLLDENYNVLSTTSVTKIGTDENSLKEWAEWKNLGIRPEGEKHNRYRHATLAYIYKTQGKYFWRTDLGNGEGKDRGKELMRDVDMTDIGFVRSWHEAHGLWKPQN